MPNDKEFELDDLESFSFDDISLDEAPPETNSNPGEDPFGVWVKSAPEDLAPAASLPEEEPAPAAPVDSLPEEDFLSTEEMANLDDSFEFVTVEEPLTGETPLDAEPSLDDEVAFLDTPEAIEAEKKAEPEIAAFDEISLDDFVSFDEAPMNDQSAASSPEVTSAEAAPLDDMNEEFLDIDIDINIEGDTSDEESAAQDVDLGEFGDFEEVTPFVPLATEEAATENFSPLEESATLEDDPFLEEDGFFEEEVFEEPMAALIDEGPVAIDLEPDDHTDMDHILALEEDLTSGIREPASAPAPAAPSAPEAPAPAPTPSAANDVAAAILGKIEQELSSIKQEISDLKREVTSLRAPAREEAPVAAAPEPSPEPFVEEAPKSHGFFDEEDDETIALTGDELDNILSTAEISEGEEAGVSLEEDLLSLDAEGNLLDTDVVHVTDEEFLAGTALADEDSLPGVPDSIELEETLPEGLDASETEDLLSETELDFEIEPLPEGMLEGNPEPLELPSDDDLGLELADVGTLAPELAEEEAITEDLTLETLEPETVEDVEGWSPPAPEPLPTPPPVTLPTPAAAAEGESAAPSGSGMSPGLKDELRAVLSYMDKLLASLPDDKIQEFAESEHFEVYKRLFEELGLIE